MFSKNKLPSKSFLLKHIITFYVSENFFQVQVNVFILFLSLSLVLLFFSTDKYYFLAKIS